MYRELDVEKWAVAEVLKRDFGLDALDLFVVEYGNVRLLRIEGAEGGLLITAWVGAGDYNDNSEVDMTLRWLTQEQMQGVIDSTLALRTKRKLDEGAWEKVQEVACTRC